MEENNKKMEEFKVQVENMTLEELKEFEQKIISEADDIDEELKNKEFKLPTKDYKEVAENIRYFLNKQSVTWQYTLGLVTLYDFWTDKNPGKISYPVLDTTLRTLGNSQMQFTGYDEWKKITMINDYFKPISEEYSKLTAKIYDVAGRHSMVIDKMQLLDPAAANKSESGMPIPDSVEIA